MNDTIEKKRLEILRILKNSRTPLGSKQIHELLQSKGYKTTERTIRFHLLSLDKEELTVRIAKKGRMITERGVNELNRSRVIEKVGFLNAKISRMTYKMSFDLFKREGTVIVNVSMIKKSDLAGIIPLFSRVYEAGYAMGKLIAFFDEKERIDDIIVPRGYIGLGTVCSITINGVLLGCGIPCLSRFGALLEIKNGNPYRFVGIINYDGTTLDPLEIFIKSGMTNYLGATKDGNGQIGVSFREMPEESREHVLKVAEELEKAWLGGFYEIGWPGQSILGIPINEGLFGAVVIGGLNPIAILEESGYQIESHVLSSFVEYKKLIHYSKLPEAVEKYLS